jgi:hypothetical protein
MICGAVSNLLWFVSLFKFESGMQHLKGVQDTICFIHSTYLCVKSISTA